MSQATVSMCLELSWRGEDAYELLQTNVDYGLQPRSSAGSERTRDADLLCSERQRV